MEVLYHLTLLFNGENVLGKVVIERLQDMRLVQDIVDYIGGCLRLVHELVRLPVNIVLGTDKGGSYPRKETGLLRCILLLVFLRWIVEDGVLSRGLLLLLILIESLLFAILLVFSVFSQLAVDKIECLGLWHQSYDVLQYVLH